MDSGTDLESGLDRVHMLDERIIIGLGKIAAPQSEADAHDHWNIYHALPREMTVEEVDALGFRVSELVERIAPSRDDYSRGHRSEVRALRWVGGVSLLRGDVGTFESVKAHLKNSGIRGKLAALALCYEQRRT